MLVFIETALLCLALFGICLIGTGTDEKNLKSFASYPDEVQHRIRSISEYKEMFREGNPVVSFASNLILFIIVLFLCGLPIRTESFLKNFCALTMLGQGMNVFDLLVIDLIWWRNSPRIRFTQLPEKALYQDPRKHIEAFGRALVMYLVIAIVDGLLLTLF